MNNVEIATIKKEVIVEASQATAFKVFSEKMDLWWPRTHHIGKTPMVEMVVEPGLNGRWYTRHEDGSEAAIGYVLNWNPNSSLSLAWQINGDFQFDPELMTEVEVNFIPDGPKKTRVKFEHKNLERLGSGGKTFESMNEGWGMIINLYKTIAEQTNT
jgi:hypothetical protein